MTKQLTATFLVFALSCLNVFGMRPEDEPPTEPSFMPDRVYQIHNPDSIDLSTGTLSLSIPIGQGYPVADGFAYNLVLTYNSNIWEYDQWVESGDCEHELSPHECERYRQTFPNKNNNAGLGWQLTLGTLYDQSDPRNPNPNYWIYVDPNGAQHRFWEKLYPNRMGDSIHDGHKYWYTKDGSYLRMKFPVLSIGRETRWVQFSDGSEHEFYEYETNKFRLVKITDSNGNWVEVEYPNGSTWLIRDQHNRVHTITFESHPIDLETIDVVSSIALDGFDGQTAVYTFNYTDETIDRSGKNTDDNLLPQLVVPLLTEIVLPDQTTYSMVYYTQLWQDDVRDRPGLIKEMHFPTKGYVKWLWQPWTQPGASLLWRCIDDDQGCPDEFYASWPGVQQRTYRDRDGDPLGHWKYDTMTCDPLAGAGFDQDRQTVVRSPVGDHTVHYFRALPKAIPLYEQEIIKWDFALPYSRTDSVIDTMNSRPMFLSVEHYDGEVDRINGGCEISPTNKIRSKYVRYEHTWWRDDGDGEPSDNSYRALTRHKVAERTVYHDDEENGVPRYRETYWFDFDGHGNFRTTVTDSNFGEGANLHEGFANFNGDYGTFKPLIFDGYNLHVDGDSNDWILNFGVVEDPGDDFTGPIPPSDPWILHTYDRSDEFAEDYDDSPTSTHYRTDACFNSTGKLTRSRKRADSGAPGGNDVITVYMRNGDPANPDPNPNNNAGDVDRRQSFGGDLNLIPNPNTDLCAQDFPTETEFWMEYEYQYGTMTTATPMESNGDSMGFNVHDWEIDQSTGKPRKSRDTAGLETLYEFDTMGRLTWIKPSGGTVDRGALIQYCYHEASGNDPAKVGVLSRLNSSNDTDCDNPTDILSRSVATYDDIGRLSAEFTYLPGGEIIQRVHQYDGKNRKKEQSEWQPEGTSGYDLENTVYTYDIFDRPIRIRPPDSPSHDVEFTYSGDRLVEREESIATARIGTTPLESAVTVSKEYDGLGNLWRLKEPVHSDGADLVTHHIWDASGRLRKVSINGLTVTQEREWTYDGRGFLTHEKVPEKDNGFVVHSMHNTRGQPGTTQDGPNLLRYDYDSLGRLTEVIDDVYIDPIRKFEYWDPSSDCEVDGEYCRGKLLKTQAINNLGLDYVEIEENYHYTERDGNISNRTTSVISNLGNSEGIVCKRDFPIDYLWSELGQISQIDYLLDAEPGPDPDQGTASNAPLRSVTYTHSLSLLTGVDHEIDGQPSDLATLSYHPNLMVEQITYGNDAYTLHTKDSNDMRRPEKISLYNKWDTLEWDTGTYEYDGASNIKAMRNSFTNPITRTFVFTYDKVSRIKEWARVDTSTLTRDYTYDEFGNIESRGVYSVAVDQETNWVSGAEYDDAGNMISWGEGEDEILYTYYPTNQMQSMNSPYWDSVYMYSADGERIGRYDYHHPIRNGITYVIRDLNGKPLREYYENGCNFDWQKDWIWRDGLALAADDGNGMRFFHLDHLGTPRRTSGESGSVVAANNYYPFGQEISHSHLDDEVIKFTGHERDLSYPFETTEDLDYMHARYYNPNLGRFLSVDPAGGTVESSQTWNRYSYVRNNPINAVDPDGEFFVLAIPAAIAGAKATFAAGAALTAATATYLAMEDPNNPGQSRAETLAAVGSEVVEGAENLLGGLLSTRERTLDRLKAKDESGRDRERQKDQAREEKEKRKLGPRESTPGDRTVDTLEIDQPGPHTDIRHPESPDEGDMPNSG